MFNNLNSKLKKIVVILLLITLTYANLVLIGSNIVEGLISYASEEKQKNEVIVNEELIMNQIVEFEGNQKRVIQIAIETGLNSKETVIKKTDINLHTNILGDVAYEDIKVTKLAKNSYTNGTWAITQDGTLAISLVNNNETEAKEFDKLLVTYVFPNTEIEEIKKPVKSVSITSKDETKTYTAEDKNFENINVDTKTDLGLLNIINKDIHKTTISEEGKVEYTETLKLDLSYRKDVKNIVIEDEANKFYNNDEQENTETTLKYNKTVISKEDLGVLLGQTGKLTITDTATNKVVAELTSENLKSQTLEQKFIIDEQTNQEELRSKVITNNENVEIEYIVDVTNLKIELTNIVEQSDSSIEFSDFVMENTKSILNVSDIKNLGYLTGSIKYIVNENSNTLESKITFKDTITRANLELDKTDWVVGEANKVNYTITLDTESEKSELFKNPWLILELPSSVESINTKNSQFTVNNDNGAFTNKKVVTTTLLDKKYVVITLEGEQTQESVANGNTTINLSLEVNVSKNTSVENEPTKLYYQNDKVTAYESGTSFDTDEIEIALIINNENKEEITESIEPEKNVTLSMFSSSDEVIEVGETFNYYINVYNYEKEEKQNLKLTNILPQGVTLEKVTNSENEEIDYEYNEETRTIQIAIGKIEGATDAEYENQETGEKQAYVKNGFRGFEITVKANDIEEGTYSREIKNIAKLEIEEKIIDEQEEINTISKPCLSIQIDELPENIKENEDIVFAIKIENKGLIDSEDTKISVDIPEEISPRFYKQYLLSETGENENVGEGTLNNKVEINILEIPAQKTYYIEIVGTVNEIDETKDVTIKTTVDEKETILSTELVNEPKESEDRENPDGENPDGENPDDENLDGTNPDGGNQDGENSDGENPDGTNPDGTNPDGENPDGGNPDGGNPDGGNPDGGNPDDSKQDEFVEGFDLSLNQYLNKATVTNSKGTTTYNYKDTNFAKLEIHSKQINGSKVTLEYKIVVKNNGTIPGYARKIVDYIPSDLSFNPDLNEDWYLGDDGNIYSVALIDKLLNPGETAELTIILEKQMTNENTGTVSNIVEIYEATNNENKEDINSVPGDRLEGQNDISKVEVLVVISTGTIILYITLAIAVIAIIGIGLYKVKKVTLNKKGGC